MPDQPRPASTGSAATDASPASDRSAGPDDPDSVAALTRSVFEECGGIRSGHFRVPAGHHSSEFWDKSAVLQRPPAADRLFAALAERIGGLGAEVIAGPAKGGMVVAWGVARHLGVDALFLERPLADGPFTLSRGHRVAPAARVVVVDDILSSGRTLGAAIDALEPFTVAGIGVLVDRSGGLPEPEVPRFPLPVVSLTAVDAPAVWAPEECPLCAAGIPLADGRSPLPPAAG